MSGFFKTLLGANEKEFEELLSMDGSKKATVKINDANALAVKDVLLYYTLPLSLLGIGFIKLISKAYMNGAKDHCVAYSKALKDIDAI